MSVRHSDDWLTIHQGDCRTVLAGLDAGSVHTVVTSPPFWGLRDYGHGDQLGLEPTPDEYVANMVGVFREVRRVLRDDGTLWLNLGDSYAAANVSGPQGATGDRASRTFTARTTPKMGVGLKPKDLVGIPWRVAFALQADGWYLRSDIIWAKPNPMPESVTDRPTKSHEYLFLLAKSERYYFDADAVREPDSGQDHPRGPWEGQPSLTPPGQTTHRGLRTAEGRNGSGRNIRSVWTIATQPYPGAHFATFPPKLVEPCILAGTSERGVCGACGAPWERVVERSTVMTRPGKASKLGLTEAERRAQGRDTTVGLQFRPETTTTTTGWRPTCTHDAHPVPATVLDPFGGSGTTAMVAQHLGRRAVLIELNPDYIEQQMKRNAAVPLGLDAA